MMQLCIANVENGRDDGEDEQYDDTSPTVTGVLKFI